MPVVGECKRVNDGVVANNRQHCRGDWNKYNKARELMSDGAGAKKSGYNA